SLPAALFAQTGIIIGKVTDGDTKLPLADVRVTISGTTLSTLTNPEGDYRLINVRPGLVHVAMFRLGYKAAADTVRLAAGRTVTHNIQMTPSLVTLSE